MVIYAFRDLRSQAPKGNELCLLALRCLPSLTALIEGRLQRVGILNPEFMT